jgi:hypothetical protein
MSPFFPKRIEGQVRQIEPDFGTKACSGQRGEAAEADEEKDGSSDLAALRRWQGRCGLQQRSVDFFGSHTFVAGRGERGDWAVCSASSRPAAMTGKNEEVAEG